MRFEGKKRRNIKNYPESLLSMETPLSIPERDNILRTVSQIHRSCLKKEDIRTAKSGEYEVEINAIPMYLYPLNGTIQGMACSSQCYTSYSKARSLVDVASIPGLRIRGRTGLLEIQTPFIAQLSFGIESCFNFNLHQDGNGNYSNLNQYFKIEWDTKWSSLFQNVQREDYHACLALRGNLPETDPANIQNWDFGTNSDIEFTDNCFPLQQWNECSTKLVKIPHSLVVWIRNDMKYDIARMMQQRGKFRGNEQNILSFLLDKFSTASDMKNMFENCCEIIDDIIGSCLSIMTGGELLKMPTPTSFLQIMAALPGDNYNVSWRDILEELMQYTSKSSLMLLGDNLKSDDVNHFSMVPKEFPPSLVSVIHNFAEKLNNRRYADAAKNMFTFPGEQRIYQLLSTLIDDCFVSLFSSSVVITLENLPLEVSEELAEILDSNQELCQCFLRAVVEDIGGMDPDTEPVSVRSFEHQFITPKGLTDLNKTLSTMIITGYRVLNESTLGGYSLKAICTAVGKTIAIIRNNTFARTDRVMVQCMNAQHWIDVSVLVKGGSPASLRNQERLVNELAQIPVLQRYIHADQNCIGPCENESFILLFSCDETINDEVAEPELVNHLRKLRIQTTKEFRLKVLF